MENKLDTLFPHRILYLKPINNKQVSFGYLTGFVHDFQYLSAQNRLNFFFDNMGCNITLLMFEKL